MARRRRGSEEAEEEGFALFAADFIMCSLCAVLLMAIMQQALLEASIAQTRQRTGAVRARQFGAAPPKPDRVLGLHKLDTLTTGVRERLLGGLPPMLTSSRWSYNATGRPGGEPLEAALNLANPSNDLDSIDRIGATDVLVIRSLPETPLAQRPTLNSTHLHWVITAPDDSAFATLEGALKSGTVEEADWEPWLIPLRPGDAAAVLPFVKDLAQ